MTVSSTCKSSAPGILKELIMKKVVILLLNVFLLSGCATTGPSSGPSILNIYNTAVERNQIAVLRLEQKRSFKVIACDGQPVPDSVRYVLLQPGRHELRYTMEEHNLLLGGSSMVNTKYLIAEEGHTYILKVTFDQGDRYPEVIDVTGDATLHIDSLPVEEIK